MIHFYLYTPADKTHSRSLCHLQLSISLSASF
uniref:Uncharacterized protein n=1 Tax=Anguilla anguilla TaxID=7936 RepID=A0A0E9RXP1_ANGAN